MCVRIPDTSCIQTALRNRREALHCELHASVFKRLQKYFLFFILSWNNRNDFD